MISLSRSSQIISLTLGITFGSLLFIIATLLDASLFSAFSFGASPFLFILLFVSPFSLLSILLFLRPSLDGFSETISFILPFSPDASITLAQGFGLLVVLLGVLFLSFSFSSIRKTPLLFPFSALLGWGIFTLTYSIDRTQTLYELLRLFSILFIFLLAFSAIRSEKRFVALLFVILLSSVIPLLTAWTQLFLNIGYTDIQFSVPRIYATFAHPNIFALYLIVVFCAWILLYFLIKNQRLRVPLILFGLLLLATFILTYARAAWGTFFLFLALFFLIKYPRILPFLLIVPILIFFASPTIQDRVSDVFNLSPSSSFVWRINIWDDTLTQTMQDGNQLLGYGLNTFSIIAENIRGIRFVVNDPHSEFVRSFVEGGYVGLGVFLFFSLAPLWVLWKKRKTLMNYRSSTHIKNATFVFLALWCLVVALLLLSFTDHVLRSTMVQWILWAMIGGALSVYGKK